MIGKKLQNFSVGAGEGEQVQLRKRQPAVICGWLGNSRRTGAINFEDNAVPGDGVFDGGEFFEGGNFQAEFASGKALQVRAGGGGFEVGKFPKVGVDDAGGALSDEEFAAMLDYERHKASGGGGGPLAEVGELLDAAGAKSDAIRAYRAEQTGRLARSADERAEFHEGLVEGGTGLGIYDFRFAIYARKQSRRCDLGGRGWRG